MIAQQLICDRQLRDLIAYPTKDKREVLTVYQNSVCLHNTLRKTTSHPLKDLSFSPTSMACDYGYLAVGGQRSQVVVRQLNSNWYMIVYPYLPMYTYI